MLYLEDLCDYGSAASKCWQKNNIRHKESIYWCCCCCKKSVYFSLSLRYSFTHFCLRREQRENEKKNNSASSFVDGCTVLLIHLFTLFQHLLRKSNYDDWFQTLVRSDCISYSMLASHNRGSSLYAVFIVELGEHWGHLPTERLK